MNGSPAQSGDSAAMRVTVYSTPICHWCRAAKRYLEERAIPYTEVDVMSDAAGQREMVLMTGQHGVPVILVGERAMIGWDPDEFEVLFNRTRRRR